MTVHWIDGEFEDLTHENGGIKANTFVLQESICSEQYFIFGGCISNQVSFETGHKQFWGTDEDSYPSGRIEVYLECNKTKIKVFTGQDCKCREDFYLFDKEDCSLRLSV